MANVTKQNLSCLSDLSNNQERERGREGEEERWREREKE
jgi:hypothetical protein